jgi:hypothetical protein
MTEPRVDLDWAGQAKKVDIVVEIAHRIGVDPPRMSTGSTEPRAIFELVNDRLGLGADPGLGKPELARAIVESSGAAWHPDFESRGATVTKRGLLAVLTAVEFFLE